MRCLICNLNFMSDKTLKITIFGTIQWIRIITYSESYFHSIIIQKGVMSVRWNLRIVAWKKKDFLAHYNQFGGSRMNRQLPVNVFRRGLVVHYTINFLQHKIFYDFYQESVVDDFWILYTNVLYLVLNIKFRAMLRL